MKIIRPVDIQPEYDLMKPLAAWQSGVTYRVGEVVEVNGTVYYKSSTAGTSSPPSTGWVDINNWSSSASYSVGNLVVYSTQLFPKTVFRCIRSNNNTNPSNISSTNFWLPVSTNYKESVSIWNSQTTYPTGTLVSYVKDGVYYGTFKALNPDPLNPSNLNQIPTTKIGISESTFWNYEYSSNSYAVLDNKISSQTKGVQNTTGVIQFNGAKTNAVDGYGFLNLSGDSVVISIFSDNPVLPSSTLLSSAVFQLRTTSVTDWYQYFYTELDSYTDRTQVVSTSVKTTTGQSIPVNAYVCFTVLSSGPEVSAGVFLYGKSFYLGEAQYGISSGIIDYSTKEFDEYGDVTIQEGEYSKRLTAELRVDKFNIKEVQRLLYSIRSKPVVWVASDDESYEDLVTVYGFYRDFSTSITYPTHSSCSLEIEGLT